MASGKGNHNAIGLLNLIFLGTVGTSDYNVTGYTLAANGGGTPATNLYVSLHTADPFTTAGSGTVDTQNASEAAYTGYLRVAVARSGSGWSLSSETMSNVAAITFPQSSSGPEVETYCGIGLNSIAQSSTGVLLWYGALTSSLTVNNGITPSFAISALTITEA